MGLDVAGNEGKKVADTATFFSADAAAEATGIDKKHSRKQFQTWLPALFDGEFDWDFLLPAFRGTKIRPMDFDCVIERNNKFLIFETKAPGKGIDTGQRITLTAQWRLGATIFVVAGKKPEEICGLAEYAPGEWREGMEVGAKALNECDALDVLFRTRRWFCWADKCPYPSREVWDKELLAWIDAKPETKTKEQLRGLCNRIRSVKCQRCAGEGCAHCDHTGEFTDRGVRH